MSPAPSKPGPHAPRARPRLVSTFAEVRPEFVPEWDTEKNPPPGPEDVPAKAFVVVWWRCARGHAWQAAVRQRAHGAGCPFCDPSVFERADVRLEEVVRRYEDGEQVNDPADDFGCTPATILHRLRTVGIEPPRARRRRRRRRIPTRQETQAAERRARYLTVLQETGDPECARATAGGVSRQTVAVWRRKDPGFAAREQEIRPNRDA